MAKKSRAFLKPSRSTPVVSDDDEPVHIASETLPEPQDEPREDSKVNKSDAIRAEADRLKANGQEVRPKTIVENLAKKGIEVVSPLVSQVLKRHGVPQRPRKKKAKDQPAKPAAPHKSSTNDTFTLHELLAAKQFADMVGSSSKARTLLDALDKIS